MRANTKRMLGLLLLICLMASVPSIVLARQQGFVYTPNGTPVEVWVWADDNDPPELTSWEIQAWRDWVATYYPHAWRETDATRKYNCHSYAWHDQSTSNDKWMYTPEQTKYWQDGSYVKIAETHGYVGIPSSVPDGAKVSYDSDDHSAIKASQYYFRSKWGEGPRMKHGPNHCPYDGYDLSYYKRP